MAEEQEPVSRELWYQQNTMIKDTIKEIKEDLKETRSDIKEIHSEISSLQEPIRQTLAQATKTNGRVNGIEDWIDSAKKIIEANTNSIAEAKTDYKVDKGKVIIAGSLLVILGGTIITLSIMAINSKIKEGVKDALSMYNIEVK